VARAWRIGAALLGAVVLALVLTQLFLPKIAASRIASHLRKYGTVHSVSVSAWPALELLWRHADSVTVRAGSLRMTPDQTGKLLGEAREQAVREASQTEIVKIAERQAQDIVDEARRQARETRLEMEDWADSILSTLEVNLEKFLTAVKRGRERLHERSQETVVAGVGPPTTAVSSNDDSPFVTTAT